MFRPSRSSSGPSRTQNQALLRFPALWDPKCYKFQLQEQKVCKLKLVAFGNPQCRKTKQRLNLCS